MTRETFEKAEKLMNKINDHKQTIGDLDKMLTDFYDPERRITVHHQASKYSGELVISSTVLPELRDALMKARDRYKFDLRKLEDEFAALL
jgi:Zn-dependent membrane protease YugP